MTQRDIKTSARKSLRQIQNHHRQALLACGVSHGRISFCKTGDTSYILVDKQALFKLEIITGERTFCTPQGMTTRKSWVRETHIGANMELEMPKNKKLLSYLTFVIPPLGHY